MNSVVSALIQNNGSMALNS